MGKRRKASGGRSSLQRLEEAIAMLDKQESKVCQLFLSLVETEAVAAGLTAIDFSVWEDRYRRGRDMVPCPPSIGWLVRKFLHRFPRGVVGSWTAEKGWR